jgi:dolichyl-phosphate beta-glucosyltransferase
MNIQPASRLVLVIPCYNEGERLPLFLPGLVETLADVDCVIQVVDDGSRRAETDATGALVEKWRSQFPKRLAPMLALSANQGKGGAIRAGWQAHQGCESLGFVDADGSISPAEVRRVVELALASPKQAYFASRIKMLGRHVHRSSLRHLVGRFFATAVSLRLNIPVYDVQCGLKILPGAVYSPDTPFEENGFAFDLELLVALFDQHFSIQEVPIDWTHIPGSKVRLFRDSVRMFSSLQQVARRRPKWTSPNKIK